jgi:DNA-binding NarL/FixJ family response regulator
MLSELAGIEIVGQAQDAPEAVRAIRELKPDIVTLDIQLIGGSGIEVLEKIKQEEHAPVVIMLTNLSSLPYRKRCSVAGADFFLDKSTEFGKVRKIIQVLLKGCNPSAAEAPLICFAEQ